MRVDVVVTAFIDRMAHLRADTKALEQERCHPEVQWTLVWRGKSLVKASMSEGVWLSRVPKVDCKHETYLGRDRIGRPHFAGDISLVEDPEALNLGRFVDLRRGGFRLPPPEFEPLAYAKGMIHWHDSAKYCEQCGSSDLEAGKGGFERACQACGHRAYPRSDPAVMMLVVCGDECLLARQPRFPPNMYSALAGFVEPGESLEECVVRETFEEVGLRVRRTEYFASQPWPFPRSLMVGFFAEVSSKEGLRLEEEELEDARWISKAEIKDPQGWFYPPAISLAHPLIRKFAGA